MQTELQSEGDFAAAEGEDSVVEEAAVTGTLPCRALGLMHAYQGIPAPACHCRRPSVLLHDQQPTQPHTLHTTHHTGLGRTQKMLESALTLGRVATFEQTTCVEDL